MKRPPPTRTSAVESTAYGWGIVPASLPFLSVKVIVPSDCRAGASPGELRVKVNEGVVGFAARVRKRRNPLVVGMTLRSVPGSRPATSARLVPMTGLDPARPGFAPGARLRLILPAPVSTLANPAASSGAPTSTGAPVLPARNRPLPPLMADRVRSIGVQAALALGR